MAEKFVLTKGDHTIVTTIAAEAHQLRAVGYKDAHAPVTFTDRTTTDDSN